MLSWVITFFILAVIASILGFGGVAGEFMEIAKILAIIFVILFVISAVYNLVSGRRGPPQV